LGYYIDEVLVHNKYSEFYENERSQRCYSYTADGELNDCAVLDEFGWFRVNAAIEEFDKVWRGGECKKCQRHKYCPAPIA
jgi:hypothetical protein